MPLSPTARSRSTSHARLCVLDPSSTLIPFHYSDTIVFSDDDDSLYLPLLYEQNTSYSECSAEREHGNVAVNKAACHRGVATDMGHRTRYSDHIPRNI
jgi:hypothetical protein